VRWLTAPSRDSISYKLAISAPWTMSRNQVIVKTDRLHLDIQRPYTSDHHVYNALSLSSSE
jgi:hypothetical protein